MHEIRARSLRTESPEQPSRGKPVSSSGLVAASFDVSVRVISVRRRSCLRFWVSADEKNPSKPKKNGRGED